MNFLGFVDSLQYMGRGMLGIFLVILIIVGIVKGLIMAFPEKR